MRDEGLSRDIRKWDLVALFVNVTVGAGILKLPAEVQKTVGDYSLAVYVICAIIIGLIALCFAEVGSRFSGTGGPYLYARETFGQTPAFMVGWLMWLTRLAGFASLIQVFIAYLAYFWPAAETGFTRYAVILGLVITLTVINLIGVKQTARASDVFTVSKLIPLLLFVVAGLFFINTARFGFTVSPSFGTFSSSVFVLLYVFSGFEAVLVNSGEMRQPERVIPFALIVALSTAVVLFLMIQVVCIGVLPNLANSERPLADASQVFLGNAGPMIISAGALISVFGTLNVIMLACTRLPFAMAAQEQLPAPLSLVHTRFRTPHISILLSAAAALLIALSGTFIYAVKISVITRLLVYISTCTALPILRLRGRSSFVLPGGIPISILCVLLCLWLLVNSGWREARDVLIAIAVGLVVYVITRLAK